MCLRLNHVIFFRCYYYSCCECTGLCNDSCGRLCEMRSCHKKLTEPGTTALAQTSASISSHCASQQEIRKYKSGLYCATFTCCSSVLYLTCTLYQTYLTSHEVSMWTGWSCCRSSHREFEKSLFVDSPATRASKDMATLTCLFWEP